jgi:hypothetical protein
MRREARNRKEIAPYLDTVESDKGVYDLSVRDASISFRWAGYRYA